MWPRQPVSVITNVGYLAVAIFCLAEHHIYVGFANLFLVFSSGWFHWTGSRLSERFDTDSMYAVLISIYVYQVHSFWIAGVLLTVAMIIFSDLLKSFSVVPTMFFFLELRILPGHILYATLILWIFFAAFQFRRIGKNNPEIEDHLHGAWHLLTAAGLFLFVFH